MDISSDISDFFISELLKDSSSDNIFFTSENASAGSDSDELDDMLMLFVGKDDRNTISRYLEEVVPSYTEKEFATHFRVSRDLYYRIVDKFAVSNEYISLEAGKTFSPQIHVALFLWFAGHEACSYRDVADRFNLSLGTVCRMISRTLRFLSSLSDSVIKWPTNQEKIETSIWIQNKTGILGVIGAIDGTHIRIDPPKRAKDDYIDRKNVMSICLQAICNENKKIIDMFVGYPGSVHDNRVMENSDIFPELPSVCGDYFLLGDSAYSCSKQLITPYRDNGHLSTKQKFFNRKLSSGRVVIEHTFGLLKQRFRQLYYCKLRGIEKLCHFIRACVVLHNLCDNDGLDLDFVPNNSEESINRGASPDERDQQQGSSLRNRLCEEVWAAYHRI